MARNLLDKEHKLINRLKWISNHPWRHLCDTALKQQVSIQYKTVQACRISAGLCVSTYTCNMGTRKKAHALTKFGLPATGRCKLKRSCSQSRGLIETIDKDLKNEYLGGLLNQTQPADGCNLALGFIHVLCYRMLWVFLCAKSMLWYEFIYVLNLWDYLGATRPGVSHAHVV